MADAVEHIIGKIVGYDPARRELLIRAPYDDFHTLELRQYRNCMVQLSDERVHSGAQTRTVYALLRTISKYSGMDMEATKKTMKYYFLEQHPEYEITGFSLADADMSLVREFHRFLVRFIIENNIPCERYLIDMVNDVDDFIYASLKSKRCCVCGREAELHFVGHEDVEMGLADPAEGMKVLPLCSEHHQEANTEGRKSFGMKYHLPHGVKADYKIIYSYMPELEYWED